MSDQLKFTLHHPITEGEWDAITDVDFDHTEEIFFHTKHGKEVTFVKQKKGRWKIEEPNIVELSYGTTAYEPVYRCSVCERVAESYLRYEKPIMPEDADFPSFCPNCGARMEEDDESDIC